MNFLDHFKNVLGYGTMLLISVARLTARKQKPY